MQSCPEKKIFFPEYLISMRLLHSSEEIRLSLVLSLRGETVAAATLAHCFPEKLTSHISLKDCQHLLFLITTTYLVSN